MLPTGPASGGVSPLFLALDSAAHYKPVISRNRGLTPPARQNPSFGERGSRRPQGKFPEWHQKVKGATAAGGIEPVIPVPLGQKLREPLAIRNKPSIQRFQGKRRAPEDLGNGAKKLAKPSNKKNDSGRHGGSEVWAWGDAGDQVKEDDR